MAIITDPRYGYKYGWISGDDNWGDDLNTNIAYLLFSIFRGVENRTRNTSPSTPSIGQCWIPTATIPPEDPWQQGKEDYLAIWWLGPTDVTAIWYYVLPKPGLQAYDKGADQLIMWNGTSWVVTKDYSP